MSDKEQSRMIQYMNQWFLSLQKGIKTIRYSNYRLGKHDIRSLLTVCLNAFTKHFSLPGFSSELFSVGLSSKQN